MKLLGDENMRDENIIQADNEQNKLELKKTSSDDGIKVKKMTLGENMEGRRIVSNDPIQGKKNCSDGLMSEKKVKEGIRKDDRINVTTKETEQKKMQQLTEELTHLHFDYKNTGKKEADVKKDKPKSTDKGDSFDGGEKNKVDDVTAGMNEMALESRPKERERQTDSDIVLIAKKVEIRGKGVYGVKNAEGKTKSEWENEEKKTLLIAGQPEKKGGESEDSAATLPLYNVNFKTNCVSLEFVGRGPLYGTPKSNETEDSYAYTQPMKFSRPTAYYEHVPGGYVQELPPNQPTYFDPNYYRTGLGAPSTNHPHEETNQSNFMPSMNEMNLVTCHPFDFNSSFGQFNWPVNPLTTYDPGNEYLWLGEIGNDLDELLLSHDLMYPGLDRYDFQEPSSPNGYYVNSQPPIYSPHDQVLSSPGSSPPSIVNSPRSAASIFHVDRDKAATSPRAYSTPYPESGFGTDLTQEAISDLEIALEIIMEDGSDDNNTTRKSPPTPPKLIEALNTGLGPTSGTVLSSSSSGSCPSAVGASGPYSTGAKKPTSRPRKVKQATPICSPVTGDVTQLPANFQIPYVFIEPSDKSNKRPIHTKPRAIRPKPSTENSMLSTTISKTPQSSVNINGLPMFTLPPSNTHSPPQESTVTSSSERDQLVKAFRWAAGLPKRNLLAQDDDGDTLLHLTIVREETQLVKAILERYAREDMINKVINMANKQHQTPLCLAVFLNQTEIVRLLIERNADVNVQLQRKLNCGLMCYQLIHYAAKRGKKWVPTLIQLLSAKNIDLKAFDSDGCSAMHCAIRDHGEVRHGSEKINSKDTIYHLAMHGADLNYQHGLSGQTPLHYVIEKKDGDLVGWFLGLAMHIQSSETKISTNVSGTASLMHGILNTKPSGGITALQLALNLQMDQEERVKILELLLKHGAEVSQRGSDGKLRQELAKYPRLAPLLKNGTSVSKNV